jgi:hypothetical protein
MTFANTDYPPILHLPSQSERNLGLPEHALPFQLPKRTIAHCQNLQNLPLHGSFILS